jgi:hypothetical protein
MRRGSRGRGSRGCAAESVGGRREKVEVVDVGVFVIVSVCNVGESVSWIGMFRGESSSWWTEV